MLINNKSLISSDGDKSSDGGRIESSDSDDRRTNRHTVTSVEAAK